MSSCQFVLDIIVPHFEAPGAKEIKDPQQLALVTQFNGKPITVTSSRINVNEFKPASSLEFSASPKKLRQNLEECGMPITVKYNGRVVGIGQIGLPDKITERIEEGMQDLLHAESCSFEKDGEVLGSIEVLFRLVIKCEEQQGVQNSCQRDMNKSIHEKDILFIMAESQRCPNPCDPCLDALNLLEGDDRIKLDLQRYSSQKLLASDKVFTRNPVGDAACCEIKKMARECEETVDAILKGAGQPKPLKSPCRPPQELHDPCFHPDDHIPENPLTSPKYPCFSYQPALQEDPLEYCNPNVMPVPMSDLEKPFVRPIRFCPVCLTNMSWLPSFSACLKCGTKPMPVLKECTTKPKMNTNDIIAEYLVKPAGAGEDFVSHPCKQSENEDEDCDCRCTCKFGKKCAHCRIKELVADVFQSTKKQPKACDKMEPETQEDLIPQEEDDQFSRPFLARVFSELRDLYNIKDVKPKQETQLESRQSHIRRSSPRTTVIPKPKRTEWKHTTPVKPKKKLPAGHKSCLNQTGPVAHQHGWAWQRRSEAKRHGWRPGFVRKSVKKLMNFFLHSDRDKQPCPVSEQASPILNLCKKDGAIYITLRPLSDPNMQMRPIVFKLVKSDLAKAISQIKRRLKQCGFTKCSCHQTVMMCVCRDLLSKKALEKAVAHESKCHCIENCVDKLILTDTSDSEMEFDFDVSPPAASAVASKRNPPGQTNRNTQTHKNDLMVEPKWPRPLNPYWRAYDCAAGDRYTGTAFGLPGEQVFEDGVFGYGGGGPHGAPAAPSGKGKSPGIWGSKPGGPMRGGGRGGVGSGSPDKNFGKGFPGKKPKPGEKVKSPPIPVRMPQRYYKEQAAKEKAKKDAIRTAKEKKKKGTDIIKYLEEKGAVAKPWDPNNPQPKDQPKPEKHPKGKDGLTDAQRKRWMLLSGPIPPLDTMPRLGKAVCPCDCCNPCGGYCCYPCAYC